MITRFALWAERNHMALDILRSKGYYINEEGNCVKR